MSAEQNLEEFFGADGALDQCLQGFAPRPEQLEMAHEVAAAMSGGHNLVVEAGTGTGKTLAYLVPALLSGRQVIISTGTRTLQDQLFHRDLPMLGAALGRPVRVELLKGRSNYICLYRLAGVEEDLDGPVSGQMAGVVRQLRQWAGQTESGDISEFDGLSEDSPFWHRVTSTADNCLGTRCPRFDDCHVSSARQAAREADLVVVNHHLLMADLTMKEEGFGELLPAGDVVIVDEAHHFPDVAQIFFNRSLGSGQVHDLVRDVRKEAVQAGVLETELDRALDSVQHAADDARLALPTGESSISWFDAGEKFDDAFGVLSDALQAMEEPLDRISVESAGLSRCRERIGKMRLAAAEILATGADNGLRWIRLGHRSFSANATPLDSSSEIESLIESRQCTWIFTSATLAVKDDFAHFISRLGIADISRRQIPSPFDYPGIARLYIPDGLPDPGAGDYTDRVVDAMAAAVRVSRGRAFLLFTSHRALKRAAEILAARPDFDFPLLVQGTAPRSRLLEQFAGQRSAVLLGTATFWEGVDIRGHALVLVAIDRLPFASPGEPMLAARLESIRSRGGNPFREYQLPQAVLSLKQGVGRLIRDYDDYGVVMICDPRIIQKSYGRTFLSSLPSMPMTRDIDDIASFFSEREAVA